jgi:hypothetical protein
MIPHGEVEVAIAVTAASPPLKQGRSWWEPGALAVNTPLSLRYKQFSWPEFPAAGRVAIAVNILRDAQRDQPAKANTWRQYSIVAIQLIGFKVVPTAVSHIAVIAQATLLVSLISNDDRQRPLLTLRHRCDGGLG